MLIEMLFKYDLYIGVIKIIMEELKVDQGIWWKQNAKKKKKLKLNNILRFLFL